MRLCWWQWFGDAKVSLPQILLAWVLGHQYLLPSPHVTWKDAFPDLSFFGWSISCEIDLSWSSLNEVFRFGFGGNKVPVLPVSLGHLGLWILKVTIKLPTTFEISFSRVCNLLSNLEILMFDSNYYFWVILSPLNFRQADVLAWYVDVLLQRPSSTKSRRRDIWNLLQFS